jgi:hypothetical protein
MYIKPVTDVMTSRSRATHLYLFVLLDDVSGTLLVAQLVEALRYKLEGRGFDFR